jgi:antitoxin ChpS
MGLNVAASEATCARHQSSQGWRFCHAGVPPALLDLLQLEPGAKVGIAVRNGRLVVEPRPRPRYTLDELLAESNPTGRRGRKEQQWASDKAVGRELI